LPTAIGGIDAEDRDRLIMFGQFVDQVPHGTCRESFRDHYNSGRLVMSGRNKFGGGLREAVVAGIAATGFIEKGEDGNPKAERHRMACACLLAIWEPG
jgi:hypothetical protein